MARFSGAVLAGGASRRMGRDKAFVEVGGVPLAAIAAAALRGAGAAPIVAVGGDAERLAALGLDPVADRWPGAGPLGGIVTALSAAPAGVVVVLACDLPFVTAEAVEAVAGALGDADAAVPEVGGRLEPLLAAYRDTCTAPFTEALAAGRGAVRDALARVRVERVTLADPRWVANANTPEDLP